MDNLAVPKPISFVDQSLTFRRTDCEEFMDAFETASDLAAVARFDDQVAALEYGEVIRRCSTVDDAERLSDSASGVTNFRERAGHTQSALAKQVKISPSDLSEVERGKKPGSAATLKALAAVLNIPVDRLVGLNRQT